MCLRISSALLLSILLTACGSESPPPPGDDIACAIGAGAEFSPVCTLERAGAELIIHHPEGGFRRLTRDPANGALATRDGADPLVLDANAPGEVQFAIGADRYRIPLALLDGTS